LNLTIQEGGRLNPGTVSLDKTDFFATIPEARTEQSANLQTAEGDAESPDLGSWNLVQAADAPKVQGTDMSPRT